MQLGLIIHPNKDDNASNIELNINFNLSTVQNYKYIIVCNWIRILLYLQKDYYLGLESANVIMEYGCVVWIKLNGVYNILCKI